MTKLLNGGLSASGFAGEPVTLLHGPETVWTVPSIGLAVPRSDQILVPPAPPGIYRIVDAEVVGRTVPAPYALFEVVDEP